MLRYSNITNYDVVNGVGIGVSLFVQGCPHHCYNCFNQETWDFNKGNIFTKEIENQFIALCKSDKIDHVSILGGEPLCNPTEMKPLLERLYKEVNKPIWVWSGYTWEELNKEQKDCLKYIDYLVDGRYIDNKKDLTLKFKGSSNQRIIDVKKSLKKHKIILDKLN